jgi:exopolyphosphatase/guanosine-5'-triphosphate,3'-diphosphate pyrophosphatase
VKPRPELSPERVLAKTYRPFAVVDIGSNSVRLMIYNELGRAPFPRFNEKSICQLGAGLDETGELAADAIELTLRAVHRFNAIAEAMDVGRIDVFATEAVRRARNGERLVAAIADRTGLATRILTGAEEASYSALGVVSGFYEPRGLVGDFGGGSLEIARVQGGGVSEGSVSMPLGALPVQGLMAESGPDAKDRVDARLRKMLPPGMTSPNFFAVGGGWRALARVHMERSSAPLKVTHGYEIEAQEARSFARTIALLPLEQVASLPGVPARRIKTLSAAALVLDRVVEHLETERVVFSSLGLREGWLFAHLPPDEQALDPLVEGAQAFALPQARVPLFAQALRRWTDELFPEETHRERRLRIAACALSDIAWRDHEDVQALQSYGRLLRFPFIGISHVERVFIAVTIHFRYGGKTDDPGLQPTIELLPPDLRDRAQVLGRAMLLAYRYSGGVPKILDSARIKVDDEVVRLEVGDTEDLPDSDAVRARLKLFAKTVGARRTEIVNGS